MPGRPEDHHGDEVDPEKAPLMHSDHEKGNGDLHRLDTPMLGASGEVLGRSGVTHCTFNLMNTYIGAGMMSLPHAFASLGLIWGCCFMFSMAAICYFGERIVARATDRSGHRTYTKVSEYALGWWAGRTCEVSILFNNFGILIVYMIMIGDVLVGTEKSGYNGVLPSIAEDHTGTKWYLTRWFVLIVVSFFFLQPLILQNSMHNLAASSTFAVTLAYCFGFFISTLALVAAAQGKHSDDGLLWMNTEIKEGNTTKNCEMNSIVNGAGAFLFAFIAFYNVPPLMAELKGYNLPKMVKVIWLSVVFTTLLYSIVGIVGFATFGADTDGDILVNLSKSSLSKFMNPSLAAVVSYVVTMGYAVKLMFIYPMENWCVRETASTLLGGPPRPVGFRFYITTYAITTLAYLVSLYVKSVYTFVGFVGSLTSSIVGLILPGLISLKVGGQTLPDRIFAVFLIVLGAFFVFNGTVAQGWMMAKNEPLYC